MRVKRVTRRPATSTISVNIAAGRTHVPRFTLVGDA